MLNKSQILSHVMDKLIFLTMIILFVSAVIYWSIRLLLLTDGMDVGVLLSVEVCYSSTNTNHKFYLSFRQMLGLPLLPSSV